MQKFDFISVVDAIFKNKSKYSEIMDYDKNNVFFMVNRKFAVGKLDLCQEFNHKDIDKASALDFWFCYFKNQRAIPGFYWAKSTQTKEKTKKKPELIGKETFMEFNDLNESEFEFLQKYYLDDLKKEIKKFK